MQYLLLVGTAPDSSSLEHEWEVPNERHAGTEHWATEMDRRGIRKVGNRLRPAEDATTVRIRGDELLVTDGPFVEGKEYIGGFDVIEAADIDEAIAVAAKHPMARYGLIEVRPTWPFDL